MHGDLKPENVVVGADGVARLVDFGLSTILDPLFHGLRSSDGCRNTLLYADPVLLNNTYRTIYTDLWALGWLIYEVRYFTRPSLLSTSRRLMDSFFLVSDLKAPL